MSHTSHPDPEQELVRRLGERLADPATLESYSRLFSGLAAYQSTQRAQLIRFGEYFARAVGPALQAQNDQIASAMSNWATRMVRNMAVHAPQFQLDAAQLRIDTALVSPFDALPADEREWARRVVEEATAGVDPDAGEPDGVPNDMLDELSQAARAFAQGQPATLSWETKRTLFMWFWGVLVFLALMQAQVQSESVKELMEDAGATAPYVAAAVAVAAYAWNRTQPKPDAENEDDEDRTP
ncbi:hypothetical protein [Streptomyces sp. NPDC057636]|uniref:hypothetical protein n=1 Tax=Streptomyces sp. NPDC057636 TaxID=3346189 RepID=UPI0036962716